MIACICRSAFYNYYSNLTGVLFQRASTEALFWRSSAETKIEHEIFKCH